MSKDKTKKLAEKYLAGESTLGEEEELFNAEDKDFTIQAWSAYVKQKRKKAPDHLNDSIWRSLQARKRKKQKFLFGISAVAASIALFIIISIHNTSNKPMSDKEKQALISEALSMFRGNEQKEAERNIIYEDEMIVIYTTPE